MTRMRPTSYVAKYIGGFGAGLLLQLFMNAFWCSIPPTPQSSIFEKDPSQKAGGVARVAHRRGHCAPFWLIFPPLQVAPSFACSVASLSRFPGHQLPGCRRLHSGILTDYQLGWGKPSTWFARRADAPSHSNTFIPQGNRRMDTPSGNCYFRCCTFRFHCTVRNLSTLKIEDCRRAFETDGTN